MLNLKKMVENYEMELKNFEKAVIFDSELQLSILDKLLDMRLDLNDAFDDDAIERMFEECKEEECEEIDKLYVTYLALDEEREYLERRCAGNLNLERIEL